MTEIAPAKSSIVIGPFRQGASIEPGASPGEFSLD
jgi:hypothetical protein